MCEQQINMMQAAVIKPGDRVLIALDDSFDLQGLQEARDTLSRRFPGVEFTMIAANSIAVMEQVEEPV